MDSIPLENPKPARCRVEGCGAMMHDVSEEAQTVLLRRHYRKKHPEEWRRLQAELATVESPIDILRRERFE